MVLGRTTTRACALGLSFFLGACAGLAIELAGARPSASRAAGTNTRPGSPTSS
ncbi:MAG: hypothetical protein R3F14_11960 [Polyangiaceae bacterium]